MIYFSEALIIFWGVTTKNVQIVLFLLICLAFVHNYSKGDRRLIKVFILYIIIFILPSGSLDYSSLHSLSYLLLAVSLLYLHNIKHIPKKMFFSYKIPFIFLFIASISYCISLIYLFFDQGHVLSGTGIESFIDLIASILAGFAVFLLFEKKQLQKMFEFILITSFIVAAFSPLVTFYDLNIFNEFKLSSFLDSQQFRLISFNGANPNTLSRFLNPAILIAFIGIIFGYKRKLNLLLFSLFVLTLLLTFTRTAYVSFSLSAIFALILIFRYGKISRILFFVPILILLVFYFLSTFNVQDRFRYDDRLSSFESALPRVYRFEGGAQILKKNVKNLIFGVGAAYEEDLTEAVKRYSGNTIEGSAHSLFMHAAIPYGIIAGILIIFVPVSGGYKAIQLLKTMRLTSSYTNRLDFLYLISFSSIFAFIVIHGFGEVYRYTYLFFFYSLFLKMSAGVFEEASSSYKKSILSKPNYRRRLLTRSFHLS